MGKAGLIPASVMHQSYSPSFPVSSSVSIKWHKAKEMLDLHRAVINSVDSRPITQKVTSNHALIEESFGKARQEKRSHTIKS